MNRSPPNETPNMPLPKRKKTPRIEEHTDTELDNAVTAATDKFGDDFWIMLHGIDAYIERRRRQKVKREAREHLADIDDVLSDPWGNS